jgi:sporulation protein YlmC with PRC-barrel domain
MSEQRTLDLALSILDHQLTDDEGRRCGRVDDVELAGDLKSGLTVEAILTGGTARRGRARGGFRRLLRHLDHSAKVRVPWAEIRGITHVVKLEHSAHELRLARHDDRPRRIIEGIPRS